MKRKNLFVGIAGLVLGLVVAVGLVTKGTFFAADTDTPVEIKHKISLVNGEWEPYFSEKLENYGIVSHIVKEAFAKEGVAVEFVFLPWSRGMEEAAQGKWNGTMGWAKTSEREKDFLYSKQSIVTDNQVFFHLKESGFDWENVTDLKDVKIVAMEGYFYGDDLEQAEKDGLVEIERTTEEKLTLKKLLVGRADVAIINREVGYELIRTLFSAEDAKKITHHPLVVETSENYLLLSKADEENVKIMKMFDKGYQKLIDSGKVDEYWESLRVGKY